VDLEGQPGRRVQPDESAREVARGAASLGCLPGAVSLDNRVAALLPFLVAADEGTHALNAALAEEERRTGARLLGQSTAIGDDRPLLGAKLRGAALHRVERHEHRPRKVPIAVTLGIAHVEYEHVASGLQLLEVRDRNSEGR
jgi:hypothetical protein